MSSSSPELSIRQFELPDQEPVRRLILDGLGDHFSLIDETLNPDLDDIGRNYVEEGHAFLVAELAGQIIGAGGLIAIDGRLGRIVRVSVARDHRRQGIGVAIVNRLVDLAQARQQERLVVETNHDWSDAIALYSRCGFTPYDRDDVSVHLKLDLVAAR